MRIIDRYIIKSFFPPFFYCLFLFIFLYTIIDLFGHLDEILRYAVPISILEMYYLSMLPLIIIQTLPISSFISVVYVISTMNKYDELIAMRAAGINIFRILTPFIVIGIITASALFTVSEKLLPNGMKNVQSIRREYIEKNKGNKNKGNLEHITLYGKDQKLIFIKNFDTRNNIAKDITILQQDRYGNVIEKIEAQEAQWRQGKWLFSNLIIYKLDEKGMGIEKPLFFETKYIDMEPPHKLISQGTNYEFMNFKDLSNYIKNFSSASPKTARRLSVDLYHKTSSPFTSLVLILIGYAFAIKIKHRSKASAVMGMGMSIVIGFLYYTLTATFIAVGKAGFLPPILSAHLANILFSFIAIMLIRN